jgi:minor extracellular serine protease Vpr
MAARRISGSLLATGLVIALVGLVGTAPPAPADDARTELHLVTLDGPGTSGYRGHLTARDYRSTLVDDQDELLAEVDAEPVYRWTTALNGFAAELTDAQASLLRSDPRVRLVEENDIRGLAGAPVSGVSTAPDRARGGAGVVVGIVDTGIWPESPLFAPTGGFGAFPRDFRGTCRAAEDWDRSSCSSKIVGARWFVHGFGEDALRTSSSLSPLDDHGHGTEMASIVAGNAQVSVQARGQRARKYSGLAPQARLAVYKACWPAPDPVDDGCATADLVTAIDRATRDRVDVLNLAVAGPPEFDTVERALLGAAEGDVVVVGAAGNRGRRAFAAHPSPWVLSVGATTGARRRGEVVLGGDTAVPGAMASSRMVGPARVVLGEEVAALGATRSQARLCTPGSLDASRTAGAVVVCRRGGTARVAKSAAVRQADGVGMVLVNTRPGTVESDLHSVPTVHVRRTLAAEILDFHEDRPHARVSLRSLPTERAPARVARWSAPGDPTATLVKPDLVAPGAGVLGAVPPSVSRTRWDFSSGTSTATAWTSGLAARLLARTHWSADRVRSALVTSAGAVAGNPSVLRGGAGRPVDERAENPGLAFLVRPGAYRAWLDGDLDRELNTPSILLSDHGGIVHRRVTNVSRRASYFSVRTSGFESHHVRVTPLALRIRPGESADFHVVVTGPDRAHPLDDGWITWSGADGTRTRIPVVLAR